MIFVDTSAWFARFVPSDPEHSRVKRWFDANVQQLVTSDYCVDETLTLLNARRRPKLAIEAGKLFFNEEIARLQFLSRDQIQRAWILFQQRVSAGWSFTDCASRIVIDDLGVKTAVALDQHFREFGVAVFP